MADRLTMRALLISIFCFFCSIASAQQFYVVPTAVTARSEVNLGGGGSDYWMTNLLRGPPFSVEWSYQNTGFGVGYPAPNELDDNGFPLYDANAKANHNGWAFNTPFVPAQYVRSGNFVLSWAGQGEIAIRENGNSLGGSLNNVSCSGVNESGGGTAECNNTACVPGTGYITASPPTFHSVTAPTGSGNCGTFSIGQPISGGNAAIASGTYTSGTGAVSLTLSASIGAAPGDTITIEAAQGAGQIYQLNGQYTATGGTSGTTLNFTAATGLTLTIGSGGVVEAGAVSHIGTPTIITSAGASCDAGAHTCYSVNFAQTLGNSGSPETVFPGGRQVISVTGELTFYNSWNAQDYMYMQTTGSASFTTNIARHIALLRTDGTHSSTTDDEANYWNDNIVSLEYAALAKTNGAVGMYRDLATSNSAFSNCSTFSTFKPPTYFTLAGRHLPNALYAGRTTHSTVAQASFTAQEGGSFTVSNTSSGHQLVLSSVTGYLLPNDTLTVPGLSGTTNLQFQVSGTTGGAGTYMVDRTVTGLSGSGSFTSSHLYVTAVASGTLGVGQYPSGTSNNYIQAKGQSVLCPFCTGTGGTGTYSIVGNPGSIASSAMTTTATAYATPTNFLGGPPQDKDTVLVQFDFTASSPSAILFSADGGATYQPVFNNGDVPNMNGAVPINNAIGALVYDGDVGVWTLTIHGAQNPAGLECGVPPEAFLEAVKELGGAAWVTDHAFTALPRSDFTTQYALLQKAKFPGIMMLFETEDETWDASANNNSAIILAQKAIAYGNTSFQALTVTANTTSGNTVLQFASIPSWLTAVPQSGVVDLTNGSAIPLHAFVTAVDPVLHTVTISKGTNNNTYTNGVVSGDLIGFSWLAAEYGTNNDAAWNDDGTAKEAATLGQAVSAVYGGDTTKYKVMIGMRTNTATSASATSDFVSRLLANAFISEDNTALPIQSGCVGRNAVQVGCPTFQRGHAYQWATTVDPQSYIVTAEPIAFGFGNRINGGYWIELAHAYCYVFQATGCASQSSIMSDYFTSFNNANWENTIANFNTVLWPNIFNWATTCANTLSAPACPIKDETAYEGGYSDTAAPVDASQPIFSAQNSTSCVINTTWAVSGYINDGVSAPPGDSTPGNTLTVTTPSNGIQPLPSGTGPLMGDTIMVGATGAPMILGSLGGVSGAYGAQMQITGAAQFAGANTSFTVVGNGAVAGMTITLSGLSGGTWSSINGTSFLVGSTGLTTSQIPILNTNGTPFDCSGLGTLTAGTLTYTGSQNYLTTFRDFTFTSPLLVSYTQQEFSDFAGFGGNGASIINCCDWNSPDGNSGGAATGNDIYGYWTLAQTLPIIASATVSGTTLTTTGTCSTPTAGNSTPPTAKFTIGMPIYESPSGTLLGKITAGAPACDGTFTLDTSGSYTGNVGSWSTISGTNMLIGGLLVGMFQAGQTITGNQALGINGLTVSGYSCGGAPGCGAHVGDNITLSGSATVTSSSEINGSVVAAPPNGLPGWQGVKVWNVSRGG